MSSLVAWFRRTMAWSNNRQSWQERVALFALLVCAAFLAVFAHNRPLAQQVILWGFLLLALAVVARRGWLKLLGPVLFYDLIRTARRARYFIVRVLYGGTLLVILCLVYVTYLGEEQFTGRTMSVKGAADFAAHFFYWFMGIQFTILALVTPAYTAGAIADEKERRTLEFLLATDLRNREIVLSKLASRLFNLLLLLLTGLPVLAALQFLGGIDPGLVLAGFAATGLTIASLAALSLYNSTVLRRSRDAIVLTYLMVLVYLGLSGLSWLLLTPVLNWSQFPSTDSWTSPVTLEDLVEWFNAGNFIAAIFRLAFRVGTGTPLDQVLPSLLRNYALFHGLLILLWPVLAVWRLRAVALREASQPAQAGSRKLRPNRRRRIGLHPILWKEIVVEGHLHFNALGRIIVFVLVALSFFPVVIMATWNYDVDTQIFMVLVIFFVGLSTLVLLGRLFRGYRGTSLTLVGLVFLLAGLGLVLYYLGNVPFDTWHTWGSFTQNMNIWQVRLAGTVVACLLLMTVAVRAAGGVTGERDRQTLDGLLTTPLDSDTILFGKWLGSIFSVRRGWIWLGAIWGLGMVTGSLYPLAAIQMVLTWFVYAAFLASLGLWFSTFFRNTLRSTVGTLICTIILGGGHLFCMMCCSPLFFFIGSAPSAVEWLGHLLLSVTPPAVLGYLLPTHPLDLGQPWSHSWGEVLNQFSFSVLGTTFWACLAAGLWLLASSRFRQLAGRTIRTQPVLRTKNERPPVKKAQPCQAADVLSASEVMDPKQANKKSPDQSEILEVEPFEEDP